MENVWNKRMTIILSCFGDQNLPWEVGWVFHEYPAYNTYDTAHNEGFDLHIYPISIHSNMQAIKHCTNLKGSNAFRPCCTCLIQAVRDESKPQSTYYTPLYQPWHTGDEDHEWDAETLIIARVSTIGFFGIYRNKIPRKLEIEHVSIGVSMVDLSYVKSHQSNSLDLSLTSGCT